MRMILIVTFPTQRFNAMLHEGKVASTIRRILEETKAEASYFGITRDGKRSGVVVVDVPDQKSLPMVSEPWYLAFEALVEVHPAMTPEDIGKAGLDGLAKKYG